MARLMGRSLDPVMQSIYVKVMRETGSHTEACKAIGLTRRPVNERIQKDPAFAERVKEAKAEAMERLESEAYRRAVIGLEEPVFHNGVPVGVVRKYSDGLLIRLLEAHDPKYSKKVQLTGKDEGPVEIRHNLSGLTTEQLTQLEQILGPGE